MNMRYKKVRNLAWQVLINSKISEMPVDIRKICREERIRLFSYRESQSVMQKLGVYQNSLETDAFTSLDTIFYDDTVTPQRQRFSIAHELGHVLLHTDKKPETLAFLEANQNNTIVFEQEANSFAARVLAPLIVLHMLGVTTVNEVSKICDISYTAAKIRLERLRLIRKRSWERKKLKNHGTFFMALEERVLYESFEKYINEHKLPPKEWKHKSKDEEVIKDEIPPFEKATKTKKK